MKIKMLIFAAVIVSGCSNPVSPTLKVTSDLDTSRKNWNWPVYEDGPTGFGRQNPNYPPLGDQCPREYHAVYNGHNWVCEDSFGNRVMPREDGYRP